MITRCTNRSLFIAGLFSFLIFHFPLLHFFYKYVFFSALVFFFFFFSFNIFFTICFSFQYFTPLFLYITFHPIDVLHILKCVFEHSIIYFGFLLFTFFFYYFSRFSEFLWTRHVPVTLLYTHLLVVISALFKHMSLFSCNYENIL